MLLSHPKLLVVLAFTGTEIVFNLSNLSRLLLGLGLVKGFSAGSNG